MAPAKPKPATAWKTSKPGQASKAAVDSRFHHPFDTNDSDSDANNSSDDEQEARKPGLKKTKTLDPRFAAANDKKWAKRFTAEEDEDDEDPEDDANLDSDQEEAADSDNEPEQDESLHLPPDEQPDILAAPKQKPISLDSLRSYSDTVNHTGLCYISRVPPFMTPEKLRSLLAPHGKIGRLYAAPEDAKTAYRRKKYRGNKRVNYTEAWVEFEDKKVARRVAEFLNLRPMASRKRDRFYDDLWNIRYLPRFKWNHLTDQISYERAVRDQKLKAEMEQVKRETKAYLQNVERAKMVEAMEAKKKRKREEMGVDSAPVVAAESGAGAAGQSSGRKFKQREVKQNDTVKGSQVPKSANKAKVLSKIFG
ncbi:Activator of basal transcription 1 [Podochytrium sp. JEL0797]|nr:Activator of basal transcription 1 [Podochytrium sp. JEL0797]